MSKTQDIELDQGVCVSFSESSIDTKLLRLKHQYQYSASRLSVCLTLYNEPAQMVAESLEALRKNAEDCSRRHQIREIVVAIIVDGVDNLAPCTRAYLLREGYLLDAAENCEPYVLHWTQETVRAPAAERALRVQRLVLLKRQNSGKLHSHWCYYHLVQWLLPAAFCTQMDAGTAPATDALTRMWSTFATEPDLAALAAKSLLPPPSSASDSLAVFQYASFLDERYALWPREQLTGYLTVLPGQLHMVRWRAVAGPQARQLDEGNFKRRQELAQNCPVLTAYLSGLAPSDAAEATAFLAEDRILGLALDRAEGGRWRLGYQPAAKASTDGCQTWTEFLRQRRRWLCGGTACLTKFLMAPGAPAARCHGLWLLLLLALSPGVALTSLYALGAAARAGTSSPWAATLANGATLGAALTLILWALIGAGRSRGWLLDRAAAVCVGVGATCWVVSALAFVTAAAPSLQKTFTIGAALVALALSSATVFFYDQRDGWGRLRVLPCYLVVRHAIRLMLAIYALVNANDLSWGTKGLGRTEQSHVRSARSLRRRTMAVVCGLNMALLALVAAIPPDLFSYWLPAVAAALVLERGLAVIAHFNLYRRQPRQPYLTSVSTLQSDAS